MTDIRQTLEAAFDDEPPLSLDLAAIRRTGRRRVAVRRSLTTVAALATVTAVCVPAVLGSSGGGQAGGPPPRAVVTGPAVVLSPSNPPTAGSWTWSASPSPSTPPRPPSAGRAAELTAMLAKSDVLPNVPVAGVPGNPGGPWEFVVVPNGYRAVAAPTDRPGRQVLVTLEVRGFGCPEPVPADTQCVVRMTANGGALVVLDYRHERTRVLTVSAQASDGTLFSASAVDSDHRADGTGPGARLGYEELAKIATLPGVSF
ncbi:hypothetical protein [Actinosynnema sp. NPDC023587]|uniref:hypothetical protein n=1 Tax=Actinosynnema sp. NPDC023587 TaxID=3154695 RepID=UPI00340C6669